MLAIAISGEDAAVSEEVLQEVRVVPNLLSHDSAVGVEDSCRG